MAFEKGNQFWKLRSKHGRDKLFTTPELLWEAACEYFQWCDDNPLQEEKLFHYQGVISRDSSDKMRAYTLVGLCLYLNCNQKYFCNFEDNNKNSDDFSDIITRIRETIYKQKFEGAAADLLNANIIARDLGLSDKQEIDQNVSDKTQTKEERDKEIEMLIKKHQSKK